ncbi:MAG TPA: hypothetical protein VGS62_07155 [Streptosporangiaceae bacterium]|nr:hypothetical protein [Streptosporangiaceae bacterium]
MRTRLVAGIMAISAVALIGGASVAAAGASPGGTRAELLRIMNTTATSVRLSVIATGAVTAGGYVIPAAVTDVVVFPRGTFTFRHVRRSGTAAFNSHTCLLTETLRGTFTLGEGSGRYAGIRGSGTFVTSIVAVTARNRAGRCTHLQAPATYQEITTASGTVRR